MTSARLFSESEKLPQVDDEFEVVQKPEEILWMIGLSTVILI